MLVIQTYSNYWISRVYIAVILLLVFTSNGLKAGELENYRLGINAYNESEFEKVLNYLTLAIENDELMVEYKENSFLYRGLANHRLGKLENAINDFDKVLELNDRNERALCGKGRALTHQKSFGGAIDQFNKVVDNYVRSYCGFYGRGTVYALMGLYELANSDLDRALSINYQSIDALTARGMSLFYSGKYLESIEDFKIVIDKQPGELAYSGLAYNFYILRDYSQASNYFQEALKSSKELNIYYLLYAYFSNLYNGNRGDQNLDQYLELVDYDFWPGFVVKTILSEDPESMLKEYFGDTTFKNKIVKNNQKCFGFFVLAEYYSINGNQKSAKKYYMDSLKYAKGSNGLICRALSNGRLSML